MELEDQVYHALFKYTRALSLALNYRDSLTQLHSERVLHLATAIGMRCNLSESELGVLKIAASFHDIGKIGIPDQILLKATAFEASEWAHMKQHAQIGEQIMLAIDLEGAQAAALAIRHHHEHFDGQGYPDCLAGEAIPIHSRIISIADSYDAMAQTRAYHSSKPHHEIMALLQGESGSKHDPKLMEYFFDYIQTSAFKAITIYQLD